MFKKTVSILLAMVLLLGTVPLEALALDTARKMRESITEEGEEVMEVTEAAAPVEEPTEPAVVGEPTEPALGEAIPEPPAAEEPTGETVVSDVEINADAVMAYSGTCGDNLTWTLENGTLTISGTGRMTSRPWQQYFGKIYSVEIESGVTNICSQAFSQCLNLTEVSIPDTVTVINQMAFWLCESLTTVKMGKGLKTIGNGAFSNCKSLSYIEIPDSVTTICSGAFGGCSSLKNISIPAGVTTIEPSVFGTGITYIWVDSDNPNFCNDSMGVLYTKDMAALLEAPCSLSGHYSIPEGVSRIGDEAFGDVPLTGVTIPGSVTSIGKYAFARTKLTSAIIPDSVTSVGLGVFYRDTELTEVKLPDSLTAISRSMFEYCSSLTSIEIPDSVTSIGESAFYGSGLTNVTIPASVASIDGYAFGTTSLRNVVFQGSAPAASKQVFNSPTILYPENDATWTEDLMQTMGPFSTWTACPKPCRRNELTDLDYLAFSQVAYEDFVLGETVQQCLERQYGNKWDNVWGEDGITYAELCSHISQWRVGYIKENSTNGFYAVTFENDNGEAVIAYRGSVPWGEYSDDPELFWKDWWDNDLKMIVLNSSIDKDNQYVNAIETYHAVEEKYGGYPSVTGHSLGGLWADVVSAAYGCWGVSFNAISALDVMYAAHPVELGRRYVGIDLPTFQDRANMYDIAAGANEKICSYLGFGTKVKPYVAFKSNYGATSAGNNHSLKSMVSRVDGKVQLNEIDHTWIASTSVSNHMELTFRSVDFGISYEDVFNRGLSVAAARYSFGGTGDDKIISSTLGDTLVGGHGDDLLDGGWGDDTYIYFKGHGVDTIRDTGGDDRLYLYGFSSDDFISFYEAEEDEYIEIYCNGEVIVRVAQEGRAYNVATLDSFKICVARDGKAPEEDDITEFFKESLYGGRWLICCPVNVEILDADGNVVYTLADGAEGEFYTEYGNFYVFREEDGSYGKVLDLMKGYTTRVVGVDSGTMDISYQGVVDGALTEAVSETDIPVDGNYEASLEITDGGEIQLTEHLHHWDEGTVTRQPGCDTEGERIYTCTENSEHTYKEVIPAAGHKEETIKGTPATCTKAGKEDGKKCSACGTVTVEQTTIPKLGHKNETIKGKAATCTATGLTDGKKCTRCGTITLKQEVIPATGHTKVIDKKVNATCGKAGKTEGSHCSVCGYVIQKQNTIKATGKHTYSGAYDPTCDVCGFVRSIPMYRMYDPNAGEHFYTGSMEEREILVKAGWNYEGVGFNFPASGEPVHRLYHEPTGEHLYTMDNKEKDTLLSQGWSYENVAFNSAGKDEVPQYRLHNPNATRGAYHFTSSAKERDDLISLGWEYQGIGWYSCLK